MEIKANRWKIATIILAVLVVALVAVSSQALASVLASPKKAADKAVEYVNKYVLSSRGLTASLISIDKEKIGNLRKITLEVSGEKFASYVSIDGKYLFTSEPLDLSKSLTPENTGTEIEGGFSEVKDAEVCMENGKPIVYFFGSTGCPHCQWEKPIIKSVIDQFGDAVSYHENIDTDKEQDVFSKYSTGGIPTLVIGCKYYRVGSGEASGEESEKTALKKAICSVTGNQPASVCQQ